VSFRWSSSLDDCRRYSTGTVPSSTVQPAPSVLEEHRSSPALLLALVGHVAMRRLRAAHNAHELKPRQFQILGLLHDHGAMGQGELGQTMGVDPSILVTLLNPMEARGLVSRRRDPGDRRRHDVLLTPAGERCLDSAAQAQRDAEDELLAPLDAGQREQLRDLLVALHDTLGGAPCGAEGDEAA
jgi:DNA-binding MarR family transcriptional regulator